MRKSALLPAFPALLAFVVLAASASPVTLLELDGTAFDPFADAAGKVQVFQFTRTDCPISNRYAPEFRRIHEQFGPRGVRFWLVYPDPDETASLIREHLVEFDYPCQALRDPRHELVKAVGAKVTPEVAVFAGDELIYAGRIDNRWVAFGKGRPAPTQRDLVDALEAALSGKPVTLARTKAVGCYIPELR